MASWFALVLPALLAADAGAEVADGADVDRPPAGAPSPSLLTPNGPHPTAQP